MQTHNDHNDAGTGKDSGQGEDHSQMERMMYLRFAAMIATGMFVMYWTMFAGTYAWSHVQFSQSRVYMALVMGGTMGLVMLAWMLNMYTNTRANNGIVVVSLLLPAAGVAVDRSQATVADHECAAGMTPHHILAITPPARI